MAICVANKNGHIDIDIGSPPNCPGGYVVYTSQEYSDQLTKNTNESNAINTLNSSIASVQSSLAALQASQSQDPVAIASLQSALATLQTTVNAIHTTSQTGTLATPAELGINSPDVAMVFSWGFGSVLFFWSLGFALSMVLKLIRRV